jgi:hypothetical protein
MTKGQQGYSVVASESAYILPPSMFRNLESVREVSYAVQQPQLTDFSLIKLGLLIFCTRGFFVFLAHQSTVGSAFKQTDDDQACLQNLWLLSPSIHKAFRAGHVEVRLRSELKSELLHRKIAESEVDEMMETF